MQNQEEMLILSELKGLALGLVADGKVDQKEAEFLQDWLFKNSARMKESYVLSTLYRRVSEMLEDEMLSHRESQELFATLRRLTFVAESNPSLALSEALEDTGPLTLLPHEGDIFDTETTLDFSSAFTFTGIFAYGSHEAIEEATAQKGGTIISGVGKEKCYLVVGSLVSPGWLQGHYGTKIMKAREHKANGGNVKIIPEDVWAKNFIS